MFLFFVGFIHVVIFFFIYQKHHLQKLDFGPSEFTRDTNPSAAVAEIALCPLAQLP